jgi:hypothetical protein
MPNQIPSGLRADHQPRRDHRDCDRTDGRTPPHVRVHSPLRPTTAAAGHYSVVAAAIVRIIAESATALARHKAGDRL